MKDRIMYKDDQRSVLTLDAGGTNFVFSAIKAGEEVIQPITMSAKGEDIDEVLQKIINGFKQSKEQLGEEPVAISFSFPGPANYEKGIIGDLENLPAFRGGVALGPMLEDIFGLPVFINNDGDLFAYGEAIAGLLPEINAQLKKSDSPKQYKNLFGATFGTGFGGGIVSHNEIFTGDNSAQGEINRFGNSLDKRFSAEEHISIRGLRRVFAREANLEFEQCPDPFEIFKIAQNEGHKCHKAAQNAFREFAVVAGNALADAVSLVDGLVVLGGGLSGAHSVFLDYLVAEMNRYFETHDNGKVERMEVKAFNLEDPKSHELFIKGNPKEIKVPYSDRKIMYDPLKRIGIGVSRLGTSRAVSIGAYAYALKQVDAMSK